MLPSARSCGRPGDRSRMTGRSTPSVRRQRDRLPHQAQPRPRRASVANASARSFIGSPEWPRTQRQSTGAPGRVQQPLPQVHVRHRVAWPRCASCPPQPASQRSCRSARTGCRCAAPRGTAASTPPARSPPSVPCGCWWWPARRRTIPSPPSPERRIAAQPPGPGIPRAPPSVQISTCGVSGSSAERRPGASSGGESAAGAGNPAAPSRVTSAPAASLSQSYSRVSRNRSAAPGHSTGSAARSAPTADGWRHRPAAWPAPW